jgi:phenylalanyl-tRNA synthetase alpha chain
MVHPNVLKHVGLDPNKYSGFASGFGVERVLMMKEGLEIDDLRLLYSNNLEFLQQF